MKLFKITTLLTASLLLGAITLGGCGGAKETGAAGDVSDDAAKTNGQVVVSEEFIIAELTKDEKKYEAEPGSYVGTFTELSTDQKELLISKLQTQYDNNDSIVFADAYSAEYVAIKNVEIAEIEAENKALAAEGKVIDAQLAETEAELAKEKQQTENSEEMLQ